MTIVYSIQSMDKVWSICLTLDDAIDKIPLFFRKSNADRLAIYPQELSKPFKYFSFEIIDFLSDKHSGGCMVFFPGYCIDGLQIYDPILDAFAPTKLSFEIYDGEITLEKTEYQAVAKIGYTFYKAYTCSLEYPVFIKPCGPRQPYWHKHLTTKTAYY